MKMVIRLIYEWKNAVKQLKGHFCIKIHTHKSWEKEKYFHNILCVIACPNANFPQQLIDIFMQICPLQCYTSLIIMYI